MAKKPKKLTQADHQRNYRDRLRGAPARKAKPHGTFAAARRHQKAGEEMCEPCAAAYRAYHRAAYRKRVARAEGLKGADVEGDAAPVPYVRGRKLLKDSN